MKKLDLFSGIGGFAIASDIVGFKTTQFVEISKKAQLVLADHYPEITIHNDIRTFHGDRHQFDIFTAGFPCTGTSCAGTRTGLAHQKSGLFYEVLRLAREIRPKFILLENPTGLRKNGLREILARLRMEGYSSRIIIVSAARLGASHRRQRLFIISYPHSGSGHGEIKDISRSREIGELVKIARDYSSWLQISTGSDGDDNGFSFQLVAGDFKIPVALAAIACKNGLRGRVSARILAGNTVTPWQALVPMMYIQSLIKEN